MDVFARWGWDVVTVTGDNGGRDPYPHRRVEGLAIDDDRPASSFTTDLADALDDADLVVVENLLTIPLNLEASAALRDVLRGRPALLHHHDPPWHRERFAHIDELPADDPSWRHVSITHLLTGELAQRGIGATTIHNAFAEPELSEHGWETERRRVRAALEVDHDEFLIAHPVRAIERKNIPAAIELAEHLGGTYWLLGPAEEGYGPTLATVLSSASCRVIHRPWPDIDGIYAAADHVTFPSTWEGFGNPPLEASLRRRTVSVGNYPVAQELRAIGFQWCDPDDIDSIERALKDPEDPAVIAVLDHNQHLARTRFSLSELERSLQAVLDEAGWS